MVLHTVVKKLVAGLAAVIPSATKLTLNGVAYTGSSLVAARANYVSLYDDVAGAKNQYRVAVKQLKVATPGIRQIVAALGSYLRGSSAPGIPSSHSWGSRPRPGSRPTRSSGSGGRRCRW